ncbi:MAG: hypothetical protein ACFE0I_22595 [Elainellaceae cyanobacterium]
MIGCLKLVGFFILGLIYLILLAAAPKTAIVLGVATLIGYFFWSRQQKEKKRRKVEEERRQAEEQRKIAEEQRRKAIVLARQREDLYEYDPSIQPLDKRSTKNIFENPKDWAASIQRRYEVAQKYISDAELVLNDDVQEFNRYRNQLQTELVPRYENAIKPYFNELSFRDNDIPTPKELKVAIDFTYPNSLQPTIIHGELTGISSRFARSIANSFQGKNLMKLQKGDVASIAVSIAISAAISGIFYLFTASQQRTKLEKLQAEVDLLCEQISGAIKTYGKASQEIKHAKLVHEVAVNYMMRYLDAVIQLSSQEKQFSELEIEEQKAVETCYRGGESLKKILQQDLIQPIG